MKWGKEQKTDPILILNCFRLGKTVEICSLIMAHPSPHQIEYGKFDELMKTLNYGSPAKVKEPVKKEEEEDGNKRRSARLRAVEQVKQMPETKPRDRSWQPDPVPIPTTLIVTPESILNQWFEELQKHMPEMRVFYYRGMNDLGQEANQQGRSTSFFGRLPKLTRGASGGMHFDPRQFADYDIVLTTYGKKQSLKGCLRS